MKKYIFFTTLLFCFLTVFTVNATEYIVELDRDISMTGVDNAESFGVVSAPDRYVYTTEDIDTINLLEQKGMVVYYEEDIPLVFDEGIIATPSNDISVVSDVYTPVNRNKNVSLMFNVSLQGYIDPNTLSYAVFTNNLVARRIPKGTHKVRVGIIDSGICKTDENGNLRSDFSNVVDGKSFVDEEPFTDEINHGTPCAGLIGSQYLGISPDCEMISLKAFNNRSGSLTDVANAIYAGVDYYGCKVLNISAGSSVFTEELENAVNYALDKNVIVVASVGNEATTSNAVMYPANFPGVIGVGSVNENGAHSSFSRINSTVDACAIGEDVLVPVSRDKYSFNYGYMSGTSFSAPQIAGLAALLCSYDYDMTPDEFYEVLEAICFDPGDCGYDTTFGHGIMDVKEAYDFVINQPLYYISRMFRNGDCLNYKIYNNTAETKAVCIITANYDYLGRVMNYASGRKFARTKTALSLSKEITCDFSQGEYFRLMLWKTFDSMHPLCTGRSYFPD